MNAPNGVGLVAWAIGGNGDGAVSIINSGTVSGEGTSANPVVGIITDGGDASLTNAGTITAPLASDLAIGESGGNITINNTGTITGEVALANTQFNNESGGVWDMSGNNIFDG